MSLLPHSYVGSTIDENEKPKLLHAAMMILLEKINPGCTLLFSFKDGVAQVCHTKTNGDTVTLRRSSDGAKLEMVETSPQ